ncbi:SDR family NAD(P)-dependent oxidoreductase [Diaminobutyricibacter tongyongensis]|uniref:SDR family NAD(P)-dependent oxidoreductase n=1 Tax=Leifsonia tongyongensis TaxID=1268043 RepID=A0A6L9XV61_9MICO|nr:SDR family NAD(P)-dependent oxidoreductase [Diaminobutyricibacter tongyongensis]
MSRILVTGSTDGIGLATVRALVGKGHRVVAHARSQRRAEEVRGELHGVETVLIGDLSSRDDVIALASEANASGRFDAIIHNAGIGATEPVRHATTEGHAHVLAINALAPFILTALIEPPDRLIYVTSGMHAQGDTSLSDLQWRDREWDPLQAYADSKLLMIALAFAVARRWPRVSSNAIDPGWVPTKMAKGQNATDDLALAHVTQVWLATSYAPEAIKSGRYLHHMQPLNALALAHDPGFQDRALAGMERLTGLRLPLGRPLGR